MLQHNPKTCTCAEHLRCMQVPNLRNGCIEASDGMGRYSSLAESNRVLFLTTICVFAVDSTEIADSKMSPRRRRGHNQYLPLVQSLRRVFVWRPVVMSLVVKRVPTLFPMVGELKRMFLLVFLSLQSREQQSTFSTSRCSPNFEPTYDALLFHRGACVGPLHVNYCPHSRPSIQR